MDRADLITACMALRALVRMDSLTLTELGMKHNVVLMRVAAEVRESAAGPHPYLPMIEAATWLERIAKGNPGGKKCDLDVIAHALTDLNRLAGEPPAGSNRQQRRAHDKARRLIRDGVDVR